MDVLEVRVEDPTFEETFKSFTYWDKPYYDGQVFEDGSVTHWQPLPAPPEPN